MIGALAYLASCSTRNRLARQLRRLRTPRYFIAVLLGLLYIWAIVEQQRTARSGADPGSAGWVEVIAALGVAGAVAWAWVFGSERRVLAFSPADVTFLFAGPVTRRGLVTYKLLRSQLTVLFNVLFWTLLLSGESFGASPWLRAISLWVLLTTLSLHRLGASFVRGGLKQHGGTALRRSALPLLAAGSGIAVLGWALWSKAGGLTAALHEGNPDAFLAVLTGAMRQPPFRWLLIPFQLMIRPLTAPSADAWVHAIGPAMGILVLHFVWVIRSDAAFEEAAVAHTMARARRDLPEERARSALAKSALRGLPPLLRLRPTGWPAGAIFWKSLVSVVRVRPVRGLGITGLAAGGVLAFLSFGSGTPVAEILGTLALIWAVLMLLIGPQWIRNDLRDDLPNFDLLRSYPVPGRSLVAAEVAGSALVLTAIQLGLLAVAYLAFLGNGDMPLTLQERSLVLLAAAVCLPPVNYLAMLIQNGGALLFPAWVRVGPERAGGVEALGQNMVLIVAHTGLLGLLIAVPMAAAGGTYLVLEPVIGDWAEFPGAAAAVSILLLEARMIVGWLGGVLEGTDPPAVAPGG